MRGPCQRTKKKNTKNLGRGGVISTLGMISNGSIRELEELKIRGRDHRDYSIVKIGLNTEKNPGNLRRLAVSQTPVKDHQQTLVRKAHKEL